MHPQLGASVLSIPAAARCSLTPWWGCAVAMPQGGPFSLAECVSLFSLQRYAAAIRLLRIAAPCNPTKSLSELVLTEDHKQAQGCEGCGEHSSTQMRVEWAAHAPCGLNGRGRAALPSRAGGGQGGGAVTRGPFFVCRRDERTRGHIEALGCVTSGPRGRAGPGRRHGPARVPRPQHPPHRRRCRRRCSQAARAERDAAAGD